MAEEKTKLVGIKFDALPHAAEAAIWSYITRELSRRNLLMQDGAKVSEQRRETFRVKMSDVKVKAITEATQKLPQQDILASVVDLSIGGICISIDKQMAIAKGGVIYLNLDFCQQGLSVRGVILGLRGE